MDSFVLTALLVAAACHAGWNALVKLDVEPIVAISLISVVTALLVAPLVPFVAGPAPGSWPFLAASLALHLGYYVALAEAYRAGDLGQVYPIARGSAPLITTLAAWLVAGERLSATAVAGILLLAAAILALALARGVGPGRMHPRALAFSLATAAAIAAYTVVDGIGARRAGPAEAYIVWLFLLDGVMMAAFCLWHGAAASAAVRRAPLKILAGGGMALASYAITIWAMTLAPIAMVAAVRETSVLFAALLGIALLGEPVRAARLLAVAAAFCGVLLIRAG